MGAHGVGQFDAHVAQATDADYADFLARASAPLTQRRVGGNPGAEQRRDGGQLRLGMTNPQHIALVHDDVLRIAAEGPARCVRGREVVGADHAVTVVFQTGLAVLAVLAAVDDATDTDQIADLVVFDVIANRRDAADDFMAGHARELRTSPFGAHLMQVGMADAAEGDIDLHVVRGWRTAFDLHGLKGFVASVGAIGLYEHVSILHGVVGRPLLRLGRSAK